MLDWDIQDLFDLVIENKIQRQILPNKKSFQSKDLDAKSFFAAWLGDLNGRIPNQMHPSSQLVT